MYVPAAFSEHDPQFVAQFVAAHPLAQMVTMTNDGLTANPLPLIYEPAPDGLGSLVGHVARANTVWSKSLLDVETLVIFAGDGSYVSPNWYPSKAEHGKVVPTWNYEAVHMRGSLIIHDDSDWKRALVSRLTAIHEVASPQPWAITDAPADYIDAMLKAIVGVEVRVSSIQAKRKLSQNRPASDRAAVIAALSELDGSAAGVAASMNTLPA
ncbi:MAG TPA: FMN-binding negative transcriptional regulator [Ilumatobacteraceae bacterium]